MNNHSVNPALLEQNHLYKKLKTEHDVLETKIEELRTQPSSDSLHLVMLKKKKLMVVDKMNQLQAQEKLN